MKPTGLMRHLVRLVTPPGGLVLDPFLGSGTTAIAALEEGFRCIGIEKEPEYMKIAEARLNGRQVGLGLDVTAPRRKRSGIGRQFDPKYDLRRKDHNRVLEELNAESRAILQERPALPSMKGEPR